MSTERIIKILKFMAMGAVISIIAQHFCFSFFHAIILAGCSGILFSDRI
jgi:hypothetical protein